MSKKFRLKSKKIFAQIFNKSDFVKHETDLKFLFLKNDLAHMRVGIAVNKKNNAVQKNKIKRIVREGIRNYVLQTKKSLDIVVYVKLIWQDKIDSQKIRKQIGNIISKII